MVARFIFLHIPKSAGSSQREVLFDVYSRKNVFWLNVDEKKYTLDASDCVVVGGHQPISFYGNNPENLYCSVVREPISRVVSYFSYCTQPDLAADAGWYNERLKQKEKWMDLGVDCNSIVKSIEKSKSFRMEISNIQCQYLSMGKATFDDAIKTIRGGNFVVGTFDNLLLFNNTLSNLLGWGDVKEYTTNRSKGNKNYSFLEEKGAVELIRELNQEDIKLHNYLVDECGGILNIIKDRDKCINNFSASAVMGQNYLSFHAWDLVHLYGKGIVKIERGKVAHTKISIVNKSKQYIHAAGEDSIYIGYHIKDKEGNIIVFEGGRSPLKKPIAPESFEEQNLKILIPDSVYDKAHSIQVSLICKDQFWVEAKNIFHVCWLFLVKD